LTTRRDATRFLFTHAPAVAETEVILLVASELLLVYARLHADALMPKYGVSRCPAVPYDGAAA
jgi:hypothetical protein